MLGKINATAKNAVVSCARSFAQAVKRLVDPTCSVATVLAGTARDVVRSRAELAAENALLRQQRIVVRREVGRPTLRNGDRLLMVLLARLNRAWRDALLVVKPETLLRWHRDLFKLFWRSRAKILVSTVV